MEIAQKYSHLNGEEYLIVHHNSLYEEIKQVITDIDGADFFTKISKEKTIRGKMLLSPKGLNQAFNERFNKKGWFES